MCAGLAVGRESNESILLARCKDGDREAFGILFTQYREKGLQFAKRFVKNEADAEDILADAYKKALEHIQDFKEVSSFKTWLFTIVRNIALNKIARMREQPTTRSDLQAVGAPATQEDRMIREESDAQLRAAMRMLRDRDRMILQMSMDNMSAKDIADQLKMREVTVRVQLYRAREKLKRIMEAEPIGKSAPDKVIL